MGVTNQTPQTGRLLKEDDSAVNVAHAYDPLNNAWRVNQVAGGSGGGSGGAVTIADGDDETEGAIADVAVTGDTAGTVSAKLRGINKLWNAVIDFGSGLLKISDGGGSLTVDDGGSTISVDSSDGANATVGTTTDAEATGNGSVVAILKRIRTLLGTLASKSTTATRSNVASTTSPGTVILAANVNRISATVYNDSTAVLYIGYGAGATTTDFSIRMNAQSILDIEPNYTGIITGRWASVNGNARITEFTA